MPSCWKNLTRRKAYWCSGSQKIGRDHQFPWVPRWLHENNDYRQRCKYESSLQRFIFHWYALGLLRSYLEFGSQCRCQLSWKDQVSNWQLQKVSYRMSQIQPLLWKNQESLFRSKFISKHNQSSEILQDDYTSWDPLEQFTNDDEVHLAASTSTWGC